MLNLFNELPDEIVYKVFDYINISDFLNFKLVNKKNNFLMEEYEKNKKDFEIFYIHIEQNWANYYDYLHNREEFEEKYIGFEKVLIKIKDIDKDDTNNTENLWFDDFEEYLSSVNATILSIIRKIKECSNNKSCKANKKSKFEEGIMDIINETRFSYSCGCEYKKFKQFHDLYEIDNYIDRDIERININEIMLYFNYENHHLFPHNKLLIIKSLGILKKYTEIFYKNNNIYSAEMFFNIDIKYFDELSDEINGLFKILLAKTINRININLICQETEAYVFYYKLFKKMKFKNKKLKMLEIPSSLSICLNNLPNTKEVTINDIFIFYGKEWFNFKKIIEKCEYIFVKFGILSKVSIKILELGVHDIETIQKIINKLNNIHFIKKIDIIISSRFRNRNIDLNVLYKMISDYNNIEIIN